MIRSILYCIKTWLIGLRHLILSQWISLREHLSWTVTRISHYEPACRYPLTQQERDNLRNEFVESIKKREITALASRYNYQKLCFVSDVTHGSYNVCFFVTFPVDDTHWVVRIPISPLLNDAWDKMQSEIATMRFVQRNTTIPVPTIHAYGRGECLTDNTTTTQAFLIMDRISGRPLELDKLCSATKEKQSQFYSDFGNILGQLQKLQFTRTGSLYPDTSDITTPVIGPSLCLAENDLQVNTRALRRGPSPSFSSTKAAIGHQFSVLSDVFSVPAADVSEDTIKREIFAIHSIADLVTQGDKPSAGREIFILNHGDLRCDNILVDDDLRIHGIIDWEWATILPRQLCTPPLWICGYDPSMEDSRATGMYQDFQAAISTDNEYYESSKYWDREPLRLPIGQILRHPHHLIHIYYSNIYPRIYSQPFSETANIFFASNTKRKRLQEGLDASRRYTDHLKERGLFVRDELAEKLRDFLEKSARLQKDLEVKGIAGAKI